MTVTIDAAGRIVVPKALREAANLQPGMALDIRLRDGRIEIEPLPIPLRLDLRDGVFVAFGVDDVPTMAADVAVAVTDELRQDRR
jgi:AbrB family looped-hinge helix DNA binding protein